MQGCLNLNAINYDPSVTEENRSCIYVLNDLNGLEHLFSDYQEVKDTSFTLSYSILSGSWVFFHDYVPDYYFHTREQLWMVKDGKIYRNTGGQPGLYFNEVPRPFMIDVVFRSDSDLLLETVNWITECLDTDSSNTDNEWETLTHISIWNSQQHTGRITLADLPIEDQPYRKTQGEWSFNDFRNVLRDRGIVFLQDIFHSYALDLSQVEEKGWYDQELIEDKYFIIRFEFDNRSGKQIILHQTNIQALKSDR